MKRIVPDDRLEDYPCSIVAVSCALGEHTCGFSGDQTGRLCNTAIGKCIYKTELAG